ncbi:hypothetical protein GJ744_010108 [Endocarpon pusillum]|uniref:DUF7580 domain-containing protein n=1 Tax=Endocarpon pusillum TaxID=364733 RepID=A0A8H7E3A6_9EURO|nr:hypothetical protein GJ744_010108 [Endocarpon pusillum]
MAEIGLPLAIAPLIVSAAEHYSIAATCLKRYCRYESGQQELVSVVNIQRQIFRKTIQRLLAYDVGLGDELASEMLKNAEHPQWKDEQIDAYFAERMADSNEALKTSVRLLNVQLSALNFYQCESSSHPSIGKKLRFAISKGQIQEAVVSIRRLTKDFRTLIEQTAPPQARNALSKPSCSTRNRVAKFAAVRNAAGNLYEALGKACTIHTTHQAHLSLQPMFGNSSHISFSIAFKKATLQPAEGLNSIHDSNLPMWLTVESTITGTIESTGTSNLLNEVASSLKRPQELLSSSDGVKKPVRSVKVVEFDAGTASSPLPLMASVGSRAEFLNFCAHSNLCNRLKGLFCQPLKDTCVGYLECSGESRHLVYINSKAQTVASSPADVALRPLHEVYLATKKVNTPGASIPLHERITLAKKLATAVLQFYATPWLTNSICSENVLLSGPDDTANLAHNRREPYVNVLIKKLHGSLTKRASFPSRTVIRNRLLFSLGVMLLELAYQSPLKTLQQPSDNDDHESQNTDYYTADRVRHDAASILGPRYAEVIRKCIQCDFGHGDDLGTTKLQEGFYQDVICELEELEERFKSFGLGI